MLAGAEAAGLGEDLKIVGRAFRGAMMIRLIQTSQGRHSFELKALDGLGFSSRSGRVANVQQECARCRLPERLLPAEESRSWGTGRLYLGVTSSPEDP